MKRLYLIFLVFIFGFGMNDAEMQTHRINWVTTTILDTQQEILSFEGCDYPDPGSLLPYYTESLPLKENSFRVMLENEVFDVVDSSLNFAGKDKIPDEINVESSVVSSGMDKIMHISILPLKSVDGKIYKLTGFNLKFVPQGILKSSKVEASWNSKSVLNSGEWIKIRTSKKGIYKLTYDNLQEWGFSNPENVKVYGNGGYTLSESNAIIEYDDLAQVSTWRGKDNNSEDCLYFYANGPRKWVWNSIDGQFNHSNNPYSKFAYYFLTEDIGSEKAVAEYPQVTSPVTQTTNSFDEYNLHEEETFNLINSGKQWFGEKFIRGMSQSVTVDCTDKVSDLPVFLKVDGAGRSESTSTLGIVVNGESKESLFFQAVSKNSLTSNYASEDINQITIDADNESLNIVLTYNAASNADEAWLDYIEVNYRRQLRYSSPELYFRDAENVGSGNVVEYTIQNASAGLKVYDVTEATDILEVPVSSSGGNMTFVRQADELREYVVFNPEGNFAEPEKVGEIENQNLHAISAPDFLIITHPDFINSANDLADFHQAADGMDVAVVKTNQIYNEFSSGMPDASGIRNFIRMCYNRSNKLKYVLLFGDGTYDNRNILGTGNNFIPTFQSDNSLLPTSSFVSDDYFVVLEANETVYEGAVDLGIGRIPASTTYQAQSVINKVVSYYTSESLGNWRNIICFIGDDEDSNEHMWQSETMADQVNAKNGAFITDKIYFDAYVQESTTAGERYPDVTDAINERVKKGVLILNYVGHANERFLAEEHVLDVSDINTWSNSNNLPIFVTATCEFSRFDGDETSAGEYILFNSSGGGIGLFSTTRVVWSSQNYALNKNFYNNVFEKDANGDHYRMGDIMKRAKVATVGTVNKRNFSLLADPALKLSYPRYNVVTTKVNETDTQGEADTLKALNEVTVSGYIADFLGNKLDNFNGEITPTVFDKAFTVETLGNAGETPMEFKVQDNVIYKGLASVTNGNFTFSFVVPKDISYSLGEGKIIYYAENGEDDAHGAFENFYIGGASGSQVEDNTGPEIELFLDDTNFKSGDKTSKNPLLLAFITDENGINTVGTGIGHDITVVLDGDYSSSIVLNDYYEADIDNYRSGQIQYLLNDLSIGEHTLLLKVWDVANNSSEVEITFTVTGDFYIESVSCYPNPASDYAFFAFKHNQPDASFKSIIEIFDRNGRLVDSFNETISSSGLQSNSVWWDISNASAPIREGLYLYKITIQASDGAVTSKSGKITIIR